MNTAAILDVVLKVQSAKASAELKKFDKQLHATEDSAKRTSIGFDRSQKSIDTFGSRATEANAKIKLLGNAVNVIKFPALIAGAGVAAQALGAAGAGAVALTSALAPLSGLLAAYPALLGAIGQAAGVKALAGIDDLTGVVGGLNEKLDETSEEFKQLSPQAQQFARSLEDAKGPLRDMQSAVQKPLFEGMNKGLDAAMKNLPSLQKVMVGTSKEMGNLAKRGGEFLGREGFGRDFEKIGASNAELLGRLGTAGLHFGDALRHVMVEARPLIDFLGKSLVQFSIWIEETAKAGRETGKMAAFFKDTKDVMGDLISIGGDLGTVLLNIFKAGKPLGDDLLDSLVKSADKFREWSDSASGQNAIAKWFRDAREPLYEAGKLLRDVVSAFFQLAQPGAGKAGLANLIKTLRTDLLPSLISVVETTRDAFGPALIDFLKQVGPAMEVFLGASGPLTIMVESATTLLKMFNRLIDAVPILGDVIAGALTLRAFGLLGSGGILGLFGGKAAVTAGGKQTGGLLGKGMASGFLAAGFAGFNIVSSVQEKDWEGAGWKAGGALAGGIIGAFGGPWGAAIGAAAGSVVGEALGKAAAASDWAEEALKDPKMTLRVDDHVLGKEGLLASFDELEEAGTKVTLPLIQGWRQAGDTGVRQSARMIQALKDVGPIAARVLASPRKAPEILEDLGAGQLRQVIRQAEEAGQAIKRSQVEAWVAAGKISADRGAAIIRQIDKVDARAESIQQSRWVQEGLGFGQAMTKDRKVTDHEIQNLSQTLKVVPKKYQDAAGAATIAWAKEERRKGNISKTELKQIIGTVTSSVGKITHKYQQGIDQQVSKSKQGWGSITSIVHDGYDYIKKQTDKAAKGLGGKAPKWTVDTPTGAVMQREQRGGPVALASGGLAAMVPGRSTGDRHTLSIDGVPKAKVESGEGVFVGNRKMMGAAAAANAAVPRFATGGVAQPPGDPGSEVVQAAYAAEVGNFLRRFGMDLTQGYNPSGPSVSPGHLQLSAAPSLDVVPLGGDWDGLFAQGLRWALSQGMQVGYDGQYGTQSWDNHGEGNHAHIDWKSGGRLGAAVEQIKALAVEGPKGALKEIAQGGINKVTRWANEKLSKMAPAADTAGIGAGALSQSQIADIWSQAGGARSKAHIASAIAMAESSGDPRAVSSAGARGLWQIMPFHGGGDRLFEPLFNAMKAIDISANGTDWGAWDVAGRAGQPVTYTQFLRRGGLLSLAEGGEVSIPELFPHLGSDDQDRRKNTLDRILGKIADFGIKDWWADPLYAGTKNLADYQEFAGYAALRDITDADENLIPGIFSRDGIDGTEHTWLTKARDEAWNLRRNLIIAKEAMPGQIDQFEGRNGLIEKAKDRLEKVRKALHDAQEKLGNLLDEVERQREIITDAREKLELSGNKELSESQKKHQRDRIETAQGIIENITGNRIPGVENDIQRATRERDALVSPITEALGTKYADLLAIREAITNEGYTDDVTGKSFDSLKTIQGAGSSMDKDMAMPDNLEQIFGGTLNDIQHQLLAMIPAAKPGDSVIDQLEAAFALAGLTADLSDDIAAQSQIVTYWEDELARLQSSGGPASEIGSAANSLQSARDTLAGLQETTAPDTDSLKLEALMAENQRLRMSAQQAGTFAGFFRQFSAMPQFATGGVMDRTGPALVHGREGIFTPEQMAALGGRGDVVVNVNLDGMDVVVETFIDGVLAKETRKALSRGPTVGRRAS